jgi:hypothetical protein
MNDIVAAHADTAIHVILDNLNTHKPRNDRWLRRHPNVHPQAIQCSAFRVNPATFRRPAGAAAGNLGNGDRFRKFARKSERSVGGGYARLRLPSVGLFHRPALCSSDRTRTCSRHVCGPAGGCCRRVFLYPGSVNLLR